jgi:hypothetical protein
VSLPNTEGVDIVRVSPGTLGYCVGRRVEPGGKPFLSQRGLAKTYRFHSAPTFGSIPDAGATGKYFGRKPSLRAGINGGRTAQDCRSWQLGTGMV